MTLSPDWLNWKAHVTQTILYLLKVKVEKHVFLSVFISMKVSEFNENDINDFLNI